METDRPLVAICGKRCGYLQIAPVREITAYDALPDELFWAAKAWASRLENSGAKRVYWLTLSEMVRHLHIHLYPRWEENEPKGVSLFELRGHDPQPAWREPVYRALREWAEQFSVHLIQAS